MRMLKKILIITIVAVMMIAMLTSLGENDTSITTSITTREPVKVCVLLNRLDDNFTSLVCEKLQKIQKGNEGKVEFTFFDGKGDQAIQNKSLDELLQKKEADLFMLDLVDEGSTKVVIDKIKKNNIPVVLFGKGEIEPIKSYNKSCLVGTNQEDEKGALQGKILVDEWNVNKANIDKNKDNIMQYVMLKGMSNDKCANLRTEYCISAINKGGIELQELALKVCDWNEEEAKNATKKLLLKFGDKIEAIIANNDSMAIGSIKALQECGYNKGDKTKTISVVGIDGILETKDLIKKGFMTGSVIKCPCHTAKALYIIGMNLVYNKNPIEGTKYEFDDTGVVIRIPCCPYTKLTICF